MGIISDAYERAFGGAGLLKADPARKPVQAPAAGQPVPAARPMREAAGVTIDADDDQWRRAGGQHKDKDLDPILFDRALKRSLYVWQANPLANRMIELPLAYLLGKGVRLKTDDEEAQAIIDAHWSDPINHWGIKLPKRVRELSLFGEQCWPVFVGGNGFVRVGYLDPLLIETVVMDPENAEQPIGIVARTTRPGRKKRYRVIVNGPEDMFMPKTQEVRSTFTDGDCFYFRVNDLCNGHRGRGDLVPMLDWLDAYDEFLFGELDRADALRAFVWDVTLSGATPEEVRKRAREITPPRPGDVRVHNEGETWKAETPSLEAADAAEAARLFRNHVLGGRSIPEHWFGGAAEVNRATGESMAEPTEKEFEMRQAYLGHMLTEVGRYVLRSAWGLLTGDEPSESQKAILNALAVEWPEMTTKDTAKYATAFAQVVTAVAAAIDAQLMTEATGLRLIAVIAVQLGVEIDAEKELEGVRNALAQRGGRAADLFPGTTPAADGEGAGAGDGADAAGS